MSFKFWMIGSAVFVGFGVAGGAHLHFKFSPERANARAIGKAMSREGMMDKRRERIERLRETIPGAGGESLEGPSSRDADAFMQRAYPDTDIPQERRTQARQSFSMMRGRGHAFGPISPGNWRPIGPKRALYQETDFRLTYVPAEYSAGGRVTAMAIGPTCTRQNCPLYFAAAGGGVWRTTRGLGDRPSWEHVNTVTFNAVGSIILDPNDPSGNTIWVGTGEANISGDSAAGVGLFKSTNGGRTFTGPIGADYFNDRAIGSIAINPTNANEMYVATTRAIRGVTSVAGGGISLIPGAPTFGLYKSIDGGATFTFIHNGSDDESLCTDPAQVGIGATPCSLRGVRRVALDPVDPNVVYASSFGKGIWRSSDAGASWIQIKPSYNPADTVTRAELAVTLLPNGNTRMYVGEGGGSAAVPARFFRADDVRTTAAPVFADLSSEDPADDGFGSIGYCGGQCWYDNFVVTPPGHPDVVYLGGSYQYGEDLITSNGRAVVLSTDAGQSWTDMTKDGTDALHPNGMHPDQHALVVNPNNPFQFFEGSDGGVIRSNGLFTDVSALCDARGLSEPELGRCRQLLSRVPERLRGLNEGVQTLQFQSLSVSPFDHRILQGGTQDNGTFETNGSTELWVQTFWGDGGQSGFDVGDPDFRFHSYFNPYIDVNFSAGDLADWNWISDRLTVEASSFYPPLSSDPVSSGWMWAGLQHVWRTKTHGMGSLSRDDFRAQCNEFTGHFSFVCGDWVPVGAAEYVEANDAVFAPSSSSRLTASGALYGTDRAGGVVAAVERGNDQGTLWAATSAGRVFVSKNADAEPYGAVTFARIDPLSAVDPQRFISSIAIDPTNTNHAWISYSGYNASTPTTPGHVFEVTYDPAAGTATWTSLDDIGPFSFPDLPATDLVRDDVRGDLYVATDFGVARFLPSIGVWSIAGFGMPQVEVAGLTIVPSARILYAATHGLGAWSMTLR